MARALVTRSNAHCPNRWPFEGVKLGKSGKDSYDRQRGDRTHSGYGFGFGFGFGSIFGLSEAAFT